MFQVFQINSTTFFSVPKKRFVLLSYDLFLISTLIIWYFILDDLGHFQNFAPLFTSQESYENSLRWKASLLVLQNNCLILILPSFSRCPGPSCCPPPARASRSDSFPRCCASWVPSRAAVHALFTDAHRALLLWDPFWSSKNWKKIDYLKFENAFYKSFRLE